MKSKLTFTSQSISDTTPRVSATDSLASWARRLMVVVMVLGAGRSLTLVLVQAVLELVAVVAVGVRMRLSLTSCARSV